MNSRHVGRCAVALVAVLTVCGSARGDDGNPVAAGTAGTATVVRASVRTDASVLGNADARLRKGDGGAIGAQGMQRAVSTMLIAEADLVKRAQEDGEAAKRREPKASPILERMYEAMDDVLDEEYATAIPKLEAVLKAEPTLHAVWSTLGWAYWAVDRRGDAIKLWQRLLALNPDHPMPHTNLGNAYAGMGDMALAEKHLRRAIELDPKAIQPRLLLGAIYRWTARYEESIRILSALVKEDPDRLDVKMELALALFNHGSYEEALPYLQEVRRWHPDDHEFVIAEARALLHTGRIDDAVAHAERMLSKDEANIEVLMLLADAPQYKNTPAEGVPYLERVLRSNPEEKVKRQVMRRLVEIYARLWETDPITYPLDRPIELARQLVDMDPDFPEWRLTLAELELMNQSYGAAERRFGELLSGMNTNCYRAHLGMFEVNQATKRYKLALAEIDKVRAVNANDPYIETRVARMELSRGNFIKAYQSIDTIEGHGARGAVAVLAYHGLTTSDWTDVLSVRRFRLHLLALKQAGYTFITPDRIGTYFAKKDPAPKDIDDYTPDRVVCITFDDASERTLRLATEVAEDLDLVFAMHLPAGRIERGDPLVATWSEIKRYQATGRWVFGSLLLNADAMVPVSEEKTMGSALANRVWDAPHDMLESEAAYLRRVRDEYRQSRALIRSRLGEACKANFVAYPFGDIGQGARSNVPTAIRVNLNEAAVNYEAGFINSEFGHAVNGDNPLLYQRFAPGLLDSGLDVVEQLAEHHPVFLARRLRAEVAALHSRYYRSMHTLELLARDGYPEPLHRRVETYVYDRLSSKLGSAAVIEKSGRSTFDLIFDDPYLGAQFEYFRDSLHRRNWQTRFAAGVNLTAPILIEGYGGYGELRQSFDIVAPVQDADPDLEIDRIKLRVDEKHVGMKLAYRYEPDAYDKSAVNLAGYITRREFREAVDFDDWVYGAELSLKPRLTLDVNLSYDHDFEPSARALLRRVRYDLYALDAVWRVRDWWDVVGSIWFYDYTDANERSHWVATSLWELSEDTGLLLGLRYAFNHATAPKDDYWTPYKLHQFLAIIGIRNNWYDFYYDAKLMGGIGKEDVRPEETVAYDALVLQAAAQQFDAGDAPDRDWEWIFSAEAALRYYFRRHFEAYTTLSYNETPGYEELRSLTGLRLVF